MGAGSGNLADEIRSSGYAVAKLDADDTARLDNLVTRCQEFFRQPAEVKKRHLSEDPNHGYRSIGLEYSSTPERPDLNEAFALWSDRVDLVPRHDEIGELIDAILSWRSVLVSTVKDLLVELASGYEEGLAPSFQAASYMQINYYSGAHQVRDLLQDRHEDGHLLTVLHATAPGLEIWDGPDAPRALGTRPGEALIMPGSAITALTGGDIEPLDHQVRKLATPERLSIMYFVNPNLDAPLYSWKSRPGEHVDLRPAIQEKPSTFGLPLVPDLQS